MPVSYTHLPIIQGGMGVGISLSSLAGAVAKSGGIGVISAAQPGWRDPEFARDPLSANLRALAFHIRRAKEISNGGIIGVNIMCALTHYEEYVRCCIENGADVYKRQCLYRSGKERADTGASKNAQCPFR